MYKQGAGVNQKSTVAIETLRPKLQVTRTLYLFENFDLQYSTMLYCHLNFLTNFCIKRTPHQQLPPRRPACTSGS
nr:CAMP-regulated phosphoprotein 19-related protein isoform 1 [Ipomoea batatas]